MNETTMDIQTAHSQPKDAISQFVMNYDEIAPQLPGAQTPEVRAWRDAAVVALKALGMPHRRVEEWKFTDLRSLMPDVVPPSLTDDSVGRDFVFGEDTADAYRAVFIGGRFHSELSNIQDVPGVSLQSLSEALKSNATQAISTLPLIQRNMISAVGTAFATDGMLLSIAPGTKLRKALHLVSIGTSEPTLVAVNDALNIGADAEVTLVEHHAARLGQKFASTHMQIGAGAKVKHVRLVSGGAAQHLATAMIELEANADYDTVHFVDGGALTRVENTITFKGQGARCHFNGAMLLRGREHADFTLVVDHTVPGCESRETVKAVLDDEARGVFQAKVIVRPGAQKTDGRQLANGLLLSETAEFDAKPELEIYADDVKCNHGATSGALDDEMLFYLRSRGIPTQEAKTLLVLAFVGEILDHIEDENLREALKERASQWLSDKA